MSVHTESIKALLKTEKDILRQSQIDEAQVSGTRTEDYYLGKIEHCRFIIQRLEAILKD